MLGGLVRPRAGTLPQQDHGAGGGPGQHATHRAGLTRDEEHEKRDDDFRPRITHPPASSASTWIYPWRWRKRRLLAGVLLICVFYGLVHNVSMLGQLDRQIDQAWKSSGGAGYLGRLPTSVGGGDASSGGAGPAIPAPKKQPTNAPPRGDNLDADHYYAGPIRYYQLPSGLQKLQPAGFGVASGNILYTAASLKSAANLMPMACEMGKAKKNGVHMAFLGRNALPLAEILEVNGIRGSECNVTFHDGRPDYAEHSTEARAQQAVAGAMKHLNEKVNPQAIVMDDSSVEEAFFVRAMRQRATEYYKTLIEVPKKKYEQFLWMTRLDAASLENWFKPTVEIVVQAPRQSSGSLVRLLKSLKAAEYAGIEAPRLTVELPAVVEPFAMDWLRDLEWPPTEFGAPVQPSSLTIRHRIPSRNIGTEEASLRFVESFYPTDPHSHHVLLLSPQAELHPLFFQHLHYSILQYRYSADWWESSDVMGISLDRPTTFLDGKPGLQTPTATDLRSSRHFNPAALDPQSAAPFLYQAPSSGATLIFGEKWATFHDFLQKRITASQRGVAKKQKKVLTEAEPAWTEYLLELMRARGWSVLHPASPMVTIHNELAQVPEEFLRGPPKKKQPTPPAAQDSKSSNKDSNEPFLTAPEPAVIASRPESQDATGGSRSKSSVLPLHQALPFDGFLPELGVLPYLTHAGKNHLRIAVNELVEEFVPVFRAEVGGCDAATAAKKDRVVVEMKTDDLFCLGSGAAAAGQSTKAPSGGETVEKTPSPPPRPKSGAAGLEGPPAAVNEPMLPGMERQPLDMLAHPEVEVGPPTHQREDGGFGPRRPLLRGLEVVPPDGSAM